MERIMNMRAFRLITGLAVLWFLSHTIGCGTPPWRTSRAADPQVADDASQELHQLPTGVRVALENGMFRDDDARNVDDAHELPKSP
jgi:hypothetical protein